MPEFPSRVKSSLVLVLCCMAAAAQGAPKPSANTSKPSAAAIPAKPTAPVVDPKIGEMTRTLNDEWAEIFYHLPSASQAEKFKALLVKIRGFKAQYPKRAEPLILEAITLCTLAAADWGLSSLTRINEARELLIKSIDIDPKAMEASAFITLGNLYFRLPGWPISFGDETQALQYLEAALKLYPDGLDSNYFLGDYWLSQDEYDKALPYLEKAEQAPVRPHQALSDHQLKQEVQKALKSARKHENEHGDFFDSIMPKFGE